ncbi:MAG: cytochrome C [Proteobacteria bacterium]|nr:cytochrome C [Pseudomonadota bacterium]
MKYKKIAAAFIGVVSFISVIYAVGTEQKTIEKAGADVVLIDAMKSFGELERPGVVFHHDKHTIALEKKGKDCTTCHSSQDDKLVLKFKRTEDVDQETTLDVYHENCIGCHEETAADDEDSGPVECGTCHQEEPAVVASQRILDFDHSLHSRHIQAQEGKCDSCHHGEYDQDRKKQPYKKGEEASCRSCHREETRGNTVSFKQASHQSCIDCHQDARKENKDPKVKIGSVQCTGCHEESHLQQIAKLDPVPRLDRNQPDVAFLKSVDLNSENLMNLVPFDHQRHEEANPTCRTCHHDTMDKCETCHTLTGSKKGGGIGLAQAMHQTGSERSCIGCHNQTQEEKSCKGCHAVIPQTNVIDNQACVSCHSVSVDSVKRVLRSGDEISPKQFKAPAAAGSPVDLKALPEKVEIASISKEYQAVQFPHRLIVASMMKGIQNDKLAGYFHQEKDAVCQGCHHNSQGIVDPPPACISCHSAADVEKDSPIPDLKAAYHRQCFECHEAMEIEKPVSTDCTACHKEK